MNRELQRLIAQISNMTGYNQADVELALIGVANLQNMPVLDTAYRLFYHLLDTAYEQSDYGPGVHEMVKQFHESYSAVTQQGDK